MAVMHVWPMRMRVHKLLVSVDVAVPYRPVEIWMFVQVMAVVVSMRVHVLHRLVHPVGQAVHDVLYGSLELVRFHAPVISRFCCGIRRSVHIFGRK